MGLFNRKTEKKLNAVVILDGKEQLAQGYVQPAISPVVVIFNVFSAFSDLGAVESVSLRPVEDGDVGIVEMKDGDTLSVHFARNNKTTVVTMHDAHNTVTVTISN